VEEESFTRAAARLRVSQPGISSQIRRLERELGQPLLERRSRSVVPTPAGRAVLPHARAALAAVREVTGTMEELTGLLAGRVTVGHVAGVVTAIGAAALDLLVAFHREHPRIEIGLVEATSELLLGGLLSGDLDLAIVSLATDELAPELAQLVLAEVPLVAVLPALSPWAPGATDAAVEPAELADVPLITMPHGSGMRERLEAAFAAAGVAPRVTFEATSHPFLVQLASRGLGAAILPGPVAVALAPADHRILPLRAPQARSRTSLCWRAQGPSSPAARALLTYVRASAEGTGPGPAADEGRAAPTTA
jgi:DNA-binding transcriptional LysR family regulator